VASRTGKRELNVLDADVAAVVGHGDRGDTALGAERVQLPGPFFVDSAGGLIQDYEMGMSKKLEIKTM